MYFINFKNTNVKGKGKSVPLQAWIDPEGSRKLRFPDFMTTAQGGNNVVSPTHRPHLPSVNSPGIHFYCGPGSSVGIATDYGLDGPGIESWWGEIFRASRPALGPNQPPCTMCTGSFPGVKYGRGVLLTNHPLLVPLSWKSRAIPLPTLWATTGPVTGTLYLYSFLLGAESTPGP